MNNTYRKLTPEEKLLHVIERPDDIKRLNLDKKNKSLGKPKLRISLRGLNKSLIALSAVFVLAFIFYFLKEDASMQDRFRKLEKEAEGETFDTGTDRESVPLLTKYLEETSKNNPFDVLPQSRPQPAEAAAPEPEISLKLVGIIWSDAPQAIIEDEKSNTNHLVNEGDMIEDYTVSQISRESVKLVSENVETILK